MLSLALKRPIELFNLRDIKKMAVSATVAANKINIISVTNSPENNKPAPPIVYYLMAMKPSDTDILTCVKDSSMEEFMEEFRVYEEVNFNYVQASIQREGVIYKDEKRTSINIPGAPPNLKQ
jgi:hypothetical protein